MKSIQRALRHFFFLLILAAGIGACSSPEGEPESVEIAATATQQAPEKTAGPPTATGTPAPTATATSTPTPTSTAIPIFFTGDPLSENLLDPTPAFGANCGFVDTLDFPLAPPDASNVRGGQDFGVYRERYGKNHAGEDWGDRGSALGDPVFAIGHGIVTYADGLGWGLDKGVIIIRHTFPDNSEILSFYGHLDPPSLLVLPGTCVQRGQQIANIGDPTSRPHLHFEIRHHMPHVPGPGYWIDDPTTVGWEPPSGYIWNYRAARSPQVLWSQYDNAPMDPVGSFNEETFIAWEQGRLVGLYTPGGGLRWTHDTALTPADILLSPDRQRLYTIHGAGLLEAFRFPGPDEVRPLGEYLVPVWDALIDEGFQPELAPLPGGGVVVFTEDRQVGLSAAGEQLWVLEIPGRPDSWQVEDDLLLVSLGGEAGGLWALDVEGGRALDFARDSAGGFSGVIAANSDWIYVLGDEALMRYDRAAGRAEELAIFPAAYQDGALVLLADGGVIAFHGDIHDRRLLSFDTDGALLWDRSVKQLGGRDPQLVEGSRGIYLLTQDSGQYEARVRLFAIDPAESTLELVFEGGTREPATRLTWAANTGTGVLLQIGGGSLVMMER